jgi:hypothetical protein
MRAVWVVYAILLAGIALSAILAFPLFRRADERLARLGRFAAITAAVAMTIGLVHRRGEFVAVVSDLEPRHRSRCRLWRLTSYWGLFTAASMTVGAFRNLLLGGSHCCPEQQPLADLLIGLGAALIASSRRPLSSP